MVGATTFPYKTIRDLPLDGQVVLVRADYNVPLNADGTIADDYRLRRSVPTLEYLLERGCRVVICSHLGRPDGKYDAKYSLEPVAARLSEIIGRHVAFAPECIGDQVRQAVKNLSKGRILLLENLRFHGGEEKDDPIFAEALASSSRARYFVQDGFGVVHRAHASTDAITQFLPALAGLLLESEYQAITGALEHPKRPLVAVLGGAKISDKIAVIERFVKLADHIVVGGAMANTFLKYDGVEIGKSVHEDGLEDIIKRIYDAIEAKGVEREAFLTLPIDVAVAHKVDANERRDVVAVDSVKENEMILDIGTETIERAVAAVKGVGTVIWNGTLGVAELPEFAHGSARMALALAKAPDTTTIIGGGDTADFVLDWDARGGDSFSHVSTGGGASLELMAGEKMPGIEALLRR